jgi:hypothetical protein
MLQSVRQSLESNTAAAGEARKTNGALNCKKLRTYVSRTLSMYRTSQFMCKQMQTELRQALLAACETMLRAKADGHYLLHKHKDSSCRTGILSSVPKGNEARQ